MNETTAEILILTINALGAGILLFIAGVLQKIMNDMDEAAFKKFVNALDRTAMSDPFAVTVATLPIIAAVLYFPIYGFGHWWFTAGLVAWLIGSGITKVTNMPVYKWLSDPNNTDPQRLRQKRRTLQLGNNLRAWVTFGLGRSHGLPVRRPRGRDRRCGGYRRLVSGCCGWRGQYMPN